MKKAELKNSLEAILNRNGIELSSTLAQDLLGLATIKAGGTKREFLPIRLSSYNDLDVLNEVVHLIQIGGTIMKKSTIVVVLGFFIVITAFLGKSQAES